MSMLPADAHRRLEQRAFTTISEVDIWPIRGARVEGDKVIVLTKGGNEAARYLCGKILRLFESQQRGDR